MANYLMLLSEAASSFNSSSSSSDRVFTCKTCNRQFSSFQALGGHRASHKKPKIIMSGSSAHDDIRDNLLIHGSSPSPAKPKSHECSICGLEFAIGQALGGHMRRHRSRAPTTTTTSHSHSKNSSSSSSSVLDQFDDSDNTEKKMVKKKKNKESERVLFLDLNLTPLENDLEILGITTSTTPLLVTL